MTIEIESCQLAHQGLGPESAEEHRGAGEALAGVAVETRGVETTLPEESSNVLDQLIRVIALWLMHVPYSHVSPVMRS